MALAALGVVFGDIGTSPLYAVSACFMGPGIAVTPEHVLGVLSLIFWSLVLVILLKYVTVVLNADNKGEGGVLALTALVINTARESPRRRLYGTLGILGASLFFADGAITPAISVLSAVEGLHVAAPDAQIPVLPITILVLVGLFLIQRHGTGSVGKVFGPVMLGWFAILAVMGVSWIVREPGVLLALDPTRAIGSAGAAPDRLARGACRRLLVRHRRRGAVRRHGPFRQGADSPRLDLHRDAGAGLQLFRPGRDADRESGGHQQSLLPDGARLVAVAPGHARDRGHRHRLAGGDLGRVLGDHAGGELGVAAALARRAFLGGQRRADLRADHELDPDGRRARIGDGFRQLGGAGGRVWPGGLGRHDHRDAVDLEPDQVAHGQGEPCAARGPVAAVRRRHRLPAGESDQARGRRLAAAGIRTDHLSG